MGRERENDQGMICFMVSVGLFQLAEIPTQNSQVLNNFGIG